MNIINIYADVDAISLTPSRNTRSYTLRSVPSSPGRSFLIEFHSDLLLLHPLPSVGYLDKIKSAINNRLISEHKVDLVKTGVDFSERWRRIIQDLPGLEKWKTKKDRGSLESTLPKKLRPTQ